jgi:hypothetical protein
MNPDLDLSLDRILRARWIVRARRLDSPPRRPRRSLLVRDHSDDLLIRRWPSDVRGCPHPSIHPSTKGFHVHCRPYTTAAVHPEWLPNWLPAGTPAGDVQQRDAGSAAAHAWRGTSRWEAQTEARTGWSRPPDSLSLPRVSGIWLSCPSPMILPSPWESVIRM